jgi:photosystem II stability/assembly factor-like uncharacterized protein
MTIGSLVRGVARCAGISILALFWVRPAAAGINVWTAVGPWGGSIQAVSVQPADPQKVYAATDNGIFVSSDGGASWRVTSPSFQGRGRATTDVDAAGASALYAVSLGVLYRSTDSGASWQPRTGAGAGYLTSVFVDPHDAEVLLTGGASGILRSVDGGATFRPTGRMDNFSALVSVAFAPGDPATILAGLSGFGSRAKGVLRSTDGGATWQPANQGLDLPAVDTASVSVAAAPDAPGTVYAAVSVNYDPVAAMYRSVDGGATWEPRGTGGFPLAAGPNGVVYSGSGARSVDYGSTWSTSARPNGQVASLVADPHAPGTAWAATLFRGLFKTTDAGVSWRTSHQGIAGVELKALAIDSTTPAVLYAGLLGGGLVKTTRGGTWWRPLDPGVPDPDLRSSFNALAVEIPDHDRVYAAMDEGRRFLASEDGGATWQDMGRPGGGTFSAFDLTVDPGATGVVYAPGSAASGECQGFKTSDGGLTWRCLPIGEARHLIVDPRDPAFVYAVAAVVLRSVDHGQTFRQSRAGVPSSAYLSSLAVSPSSPNVLYLGTWQGVYKSTDRGQSWRPAVAGLPLGINRIPALAVDPRTTAIVWAAVEGHGVYRTVDGGAHWRPLNGGLPLQVVGPLLLEPGDPATAYVGSLGGVYKITLR